MQSHQCVGQESTEETEQLECEGRKGFTLGFRLCTFMGTSQSLCQHVVLKLAAGLRPAGLAAEREEQRAVGRTRRSMIWAP